MIEEILRNQITIIRALQALMLGNKAHDILSLWTELSECVDRSNLVLDKIGKGDNAKNQIRWADITKDCPLG